jgi:hypothetical protein
MEDETKCLFVSTRGLAKSCNIHPVWNHLDQLSYPNFTTKNKVGSTIYLHFDTVEQFINNLMDKMENHFIIVSGNSDHTTPDDFPSSSRLLDNPKCLAWFSQNTIGDHPKLHHLPIGLDYHTLSFNRGLHEWCSTKTPITPKIQELSLTAIRKMLKPLEQTNSKVAITNFHLAIGGPIRRTEIRVPVYNTLKDKKCMVWLPKQTREEFWNILNDYAFIVCPPGNGIDTHRTWEVLCLGRIPIVQKSPLNKVYEGLPIVEVDDWNDISEEWLEIKFKEIIQGKFKYERLFLNYWINRINSYKN